MAIASAFALDYSGAPHAAHEAVNDQVESCLIWARGRLHAGSEHADQPPLGRLQGQCGGNARPHRRPERQARPDRPGRRRRRARQAHGAWQAAAARPRGDAAGPRHTLPRTGASRRAEPVRQRRAGRRRGGRHRPRVGRGMRHRLQRRDREGRHLLPHHRQEAPARAGDRAAEPPALHLPGGQRRRQPAQPGRGLPRPRPLRPHLLQPGQPVGAGHPADRGRHGLLHGRRRLRAGDERRDHHRQEPGHHLPGRPAAGEGRDGRGRHGRGPGRR